MKYKSKKTIYWFIYAAFFVSFVLSVMLNDNYPFFVNGIFILTLSIINIADIIKMKKKRSIIPILVLATIILVTYNLIMFFIPSLIKSHHIVLGVNILETFIICYYFARDKNIKKGDASHSQNGTGNSSLSQNEKP